MKRIISIILTLILLWAGLMFVDYLRAYQKENDLIITLSKEEKDEYTQKNGLGYSVRLYNYDSNNMTDGEIMKEFRIFDIVVNKQVAKVNNR